MKQFLLILFLLIAITHVKAQRMISVTDDETHDPVCRAAFTQNGNTIAYTTPMGIAILPKVSGKILIICKDYHPLEIDADSISDVIHMKYALERLEEVVVIGEKNKQKKQFGLPNNTRLEYDLKDAYKNSGKVDTRLIARLFGYKSRKERKRNKIKKNLEAYDEH